MRHSYFVVGLLALLPPLSLRAAQQAAANSTTSAAATAAEHEQHRPGEASAADQFSMRLLALFTGSKKDLGLDHRLGRQVLKLAAAKARRLYPEVARIELVVHEDEADCNSLSDISVKVAEQFYVDHFLLSDDQEASLDVAQCSQVDELAGRAGDRCALDEPAFPNETLPSRAQLGEHPPGALRRIDAILGPACDKQIDVIGRMAAYWRTPIYITTPTSGLFNRKDIYTTLTRLSPSIDHLSMFVVKVMERFKWRHLAIVVDRSQAENLALLQALEKNIERLRFTVPLEKTVFPFSSFQNASRSSNATSAPESVHSAVNRLLSPEAGDAVAQQCTSEAREVLDGVRRVARIVLLLLNDPKVVRRFLLCAHELHFNSGEFTFFALSLGFKAGKQDTESGAAATAASMPARSNGAASSQSFYWFVPNDEENNLKARQMFESLMVFSVELPIGDEFAMFVDQTLDMARLDFPDAQFQPTSVSQIAVALHDSLLLAVEARRRLFVEGRSQRARLTSPTSRKNSTGHRAASAPERVPLLWGDRYTDGLMTNTEINANGDQELNYVLSDMVPELAVMRPVASYSRETRQVEMLPDSFIHWPARASSSSAAAAVAAVASLTSAGESNMLSQSEEPPPDEPECGFTGDAERCIDRENMYLAMAIISAFLVAVLAILAVSFRRYKTIRYQMQLDDYWWRVNWDELEFIEARRTSIHSNMEASSVIRLRGQAKVARSHTSGSVASSGGRLDGEKAPKSAEAVGKGLFKVLQSMGSKVTNTVAPVSLVVTEAPGEEAGAPDEPARATQQSQRADESDRVSRAGSQVAKSSLVECQASLCNVIRSDLSTVVKASSLALYKDEVVIVKQLNGSSVEINRSLLVELKSLRELSHENLARLVGLCIESEHLASVYEYCSRGNLQDLLLNRDMSLDWNLKYSIIGDILNGLNFIHTTLLDFHGRLKSTNLVLDSRFTVKLTDFGLKSLYSQLELIENHDDLDADANRAPSGGLEDELAHQLRRQSAAQTIYNMDSVSMRAESLHTPTMGQRGAAPTPGQAANRMHLKNKGSARFFWTAPEHLRERQPHLAGSRRGDVYSLAVILYEILTCREPYYYGTNAKPRWRVIKQEKLRHQQQQGQQEQPQMIGFDERSAGRVVAGQSQQRSGQSVSTGQTSAKQSLLGRSWKRRNQASIAPLPEQAASPSRQGSVDLGDAESCASSSVADLRQSDQAGEPVPAQLATRRDATTERAIKISVSSPGKTPAGCESDSVGGEAPDEEAALEVGARRRSRSSASSRIESTLSSHGRFRARGPPEVEQPGMELDAEEVLDQLRMGVQPEPVRPYIPNFLLADINPRLLELLKSCWSEQPQARPSATQVRNSMRKITKGATAKNYLDNLLDRLQTYAAQLERIVDFKSADIMAEKMRTEELLYQLVPRFVADKLKANEPITPQVFDGVTILFSDIVGFEKYASVMSPCELVDLLNNIYSSFESIISSFDVTKIEVILDQFLVAAGISLQQQQEQHQNAGAKRPTEPAKPEPAEKRQQPAQSLKSKRGLLRALRGSQSTVDKSGAKESAGDGQAKKEESAEQEVALASGFDLDHYKRSSAEQIARMALCIRDLVKSFHFRQNLNSYSKPAAEDASGPATGTEPADGAPPPPPPPQTVAKLGGGFVAATFNVRIGIHSGKVCAGIVGLKRPKFCLIGDTVNVASRMHTNSKASRIQISADTRELLKLVPGFNIEPRGRIEIKGKGLMDTYWLESAY